MHVTLIRPSRRKAASALAVLALTVTAAAATVPGASAAAKKKATKAKAKTAAAPALAGTWNVATGSEVGYRVKEKFITPPADVTAVGRTPAVTGVMTIAGSGSSMVAKSITIKADVTQLKSDQSRRDNTLKGRALETDKFTTATFESTSDIPVPADGKDTAAKAKGKLTLHGVTKDIEIDVQAGLRDGRIQVVGTTAITMADYGIEPPNIAGFVSVEDTGQLEVNLRFAKG